MAEQKPPQTVKSYAQGVAARNEERAAERKANPLIPNLGQAAVQHDPKSGLTLQEVGEQQRHYERTGEKPSDGRGLSPETVKGLQDLKEHADKEQAAKTPEPARAPEIDVPDDFEETLRRAREDVIQNERERLAVRDRVLPMDLANILTGEFTQFVPVVPGKINVTYRCLTTHENNELRFILFDASQADPKIARLVVEMLGFYQTVATTLQINETKFPRHLVQDGPTGRTVFNREIFEDKVQTFMSFPLPLIAALGTHSAWFDMRVREMFATTEAIKNG